MKKLSEWKFIRILHMVIISIMLYMSGFFTFFSIDVSAASNEQLLNETDRNNIETIIFEFAEQEGENFGINIHKAGRDSQIINNWSLGCQVFKKEDNFDEFMKLCYKSEQIWGNSFTYTLITTNDL